MLKNRQIGEVSGFQEIAGENNMAEKYILTWKICTEAEELDKVYNKNQKYIQHLNNVPLCEFCIYNQTACF